MGMDVYGKKPTTETGKYFRASIWSWRPLAEYVQEVAPSVAVHCTYWDTNDGDGLCAANSIKLANILQAKIDNGSAATYVTRRDRELNNLPSEPCPYCEDGTTTQAIADTYPAYQSYVGKTCIQCKGKGVRRPFETFYPLNVDIIQRFVDFLRDSGGFEIH